MTPKPASTARTIENVDFTTTKGGDDITSIDQTATQDQTVAYLNQTATQGSAANVRQEKYSQRDRPSIGNQIDPFNQI